MNAKKIVLGCKARDLSTGVEGIVISRNEELRGNIRWVLQPQSEDKRTMPDAYNIDDAFLKYLAVGISDRVITPSPTQVITLGAKVKDRISGADGIAVERSTHINGCVNYVMAREQDGFNRTATLPIPGWHQEFNLEVLSNNEAVIPVPAPIVKPPSGPSTKAPSRKAVRL